MYFYIQFPLSKIVQQNTDNMCQIDTFQKPFG